MGTRRFGALLAAVVLAAIGVATLTPSPGTPVTGSLWCIACGELGALDVIANIVMFLPLGFALALATERRWIPVLACVATTLIVESLQINVVIGRDASLSDLMANSLGGWIGCELGLRWRIFLHPTRTSAARLSVVGALLFAVVGVLTSLGLRPAEVPRSLWIQWLPPRPSYEPFTGRVLQFDVNGIDLPQGFPPTSLGLTSVLSGDAWLATTRVDRRALQPTRSIIVRVAEEFTVLVSVEQHGWDLTCHQKTRSADFRFRSPRVLLRGAFQPEGVRSTNEVNLLCARARGALSAGVRESGDTRTETVRLSPSLGWVLLSPFDIAVSKRLWWVGALWLFALAYPAGFWAGMIRDDAGMTRRGRTRTRGRLLVALLASLVVGLTVSPTLAGTSRGALWEWAAALGGAATGVITGLAIARIRRPAADPAPYVSARALGDAA